QRTGWGLSIRNHVLDELFQCGAFCLVRAIPGDDEEGQARDRVGFRRVCRWVDDGRAGILGQLRAESGNGGGGAGDSGLDVLSACVLNGRGGEMVLLGVSQLDVADGAGRIADVSGDAFASLPSDADRPADGGTATDLRFPVGT